MIRLEDRQSMVQDSVAAQGAGARRHPAAPAIVPLLDGMNPALDVDGNGVAEAPTDGLMLIR